MKRDLEGLKMATKKKPSKILKTNKQARHGDLLLTKIETLPEDAKKVASDKMTLAEGTATGHAHVVAVECHSVHKKTFLGVRISDETKTCKGAIASTFPDGEYAPDAEA